jgi:glyceraldehyde-3-phosphate dehydrogenase (NAD(P))
VAVTYKSSANAVFSFGRDQGHYGRILNVTVVALPTLMVRNSTEIVGYCFTPQDGNSLLSSVSAATWLLYPDDYEDRVQCLKPYFYDEV